MFIKSVKLNNIRSYVDEKIEFQEGSTLLSGDIGCGKSTILLALDFALFGLRRGELDGEYLLRHGSDSGSVELNFLLDGKDITIKRSLKRGKGVVQSSGIIKINGFEEEYAPTEIKSRVLEFLGYPKDQKETVFRYTVYTPQEEMKQIMMSKDRLVTLRKIFGIDKYGRIRENTKIILTELRSMKRESEAYTKDLEEKVKEYDNKKTEIWKMEDDLSKQKEFGQGIDKKLEKKKFEVEEFEKSIEDMKNIKQVIVKKESELSSLERAHEKISGEINLLEKRRDEKENLLHQYDDLKKPQKTFEEIKNGLENTEKEKYMMISHNAVNADEIKKLVSILEKGICEVCGQEVHNPSAFSDNITKKEFLKKEVSEKIENLDKIIYALKKEQDAVREYSIALRTKTDIEKSLLVLENDIKRNVNEKEKNNYALLKIRSELVSLHPVVEDLPKKEETLKKIRNELYSLQNEKLYAEKLITKTEQQLSDLNEYMKMLETDIAKKKKSRSKAEYVKELIGWFDIQFVALTELIEKHVMLMIQKEFDQFFRNWFGILMQDEAMNVRVDEQFSPVIEQNSYETDYNNLSGGEKTSVALAYRLALNRVINTLIENIKTKDLLILDEPTDGFSTDQLDRIRYVIDELNLKQIIIVSHEPKIDTFVDNIIKIYKQDHVSNIIN